MRRDPRAQPQLRLHLLGVRVQGAEERDLDFVVRNLRDDHVRVEREKRLQPLDQRRVRQLDAQNLPPFVAKPSARRGERSIPRLRRA